MLSLGMGMGSAVSRSSAIRAKQPTINLDFLTQRYAMNLVNKAFGEIINFSRASAATRINAAGLIETVAANQPRFDYEPADIPILGGERVSGAWSSATGIAGVGAEVHFSGATGGSSQNDGSAVAGKVHEVTYEIYDYVSGSVKPYLGANSAAQSGNSNGWRTEKIVAGDTRIRFFVSAAAANLKVRNVSVREITGYVAQKGDPKGLLIEEQRTRLNTVSLAPTAIESVAVTAQAYTLSFYGTGTVTLSGVHAQAVAGAGVYPARKTYTFTPTAGTLTMAYSGSCQDVQLEAGVFATSVIRGEGSQVTRAADVPTINTLSPWFNVLEGSVVAEFDAIYAAGMSVSPRVFDINDGSSNNRHLLYLPSNAITYLSTVAGVPSANINTGANSGGINKSAIAYKADNFAASLGGNISSDSSGPIPSGLNKLLLGHSYGTTPMCGHIRKLRYIPKRLTNAQLQAITA